MILFGTVSGVSRGTWFRATVTFAAAEEVRRHHSRIRETIIASKKRREVALLPRRCLPQPNNLEGSMRAGHSGTLADQQPFQPQCRSRTMPHSCRSVPRSRHRRSAARYVRRAMSGISICLN